MAEWRPALDAPIVNYSCVADIGLEALGLAHRRVGRMPKQGERANVLTSASEDVFIRLHNELGRASVNVDEVQAVETTIKPRQALHGACRMRDRHGAQQALGSLNRAFRMAVSGKCFHGIGSL